MVSNAMIGRGGTVATVTGIGCYEFIGGIPDGLNTNSGCDKIVPFCNSCQKRAIAHYRLRILDIQIEVSIQ